MELPDVSRVAEAEAQVSGNSEHQLPVWAHRLRKSQVERLYKSCGQGLLDEELIDDVGFSLYARCESMLQVTEAVRGRPRCPNCGATAEVDRAPDGLAKCTECGWSCPWTLYKKTYQRKGLFAGGMESFVRDFVRQFAAARSHGDKLVLIDTLIHRFHWESGSSAGGRPGACNLIEGRMKDIVPFLDRLSYGDDIPPDVAQTRQEWRRKWQENPLSRGRGQEPKRRTEPRDGPSA